MEERRLEVFVAVARECSFSRAAATLHLSQPAVSQQVAALEAELGAPLVERGRRGTGLTDAGRALLPRAQRLLQDLRELRNAVTAADGEVAGQLVVAASLTMGEYVLPAMLGQLVRLHPRVQVRLAVQNTERVGLALLAAEADLGFIEGPTTTPGLALRPLRQDELVAIAHPGHAWATREDITIEDLFAEPVVLREPGSGTRQVLEAHLRAAGADPTGLRVALELSGLEGLKAAVEAGAGVSVVSRSALEKELRLQSLLARPVRGLGLQRELSAAWVEGRPLPRPAEALLRLATSLCAAPEPAGAGGGEGPASAAVQGPGPATAAPARSAVLPR